MWTTVFSSCSVYFPKTHVDVVVVLYINNLCNKDSKKSPGDQCKWEELILLFNDIKKTHNNNHLSITVFYSVSSFWLVLKY